VGQKVSKEEQWDIAAKFGTVLPKAGWLALVDIISWETKEVIVSNELP